MFDYGEYWTMFYIKLEVLKIWKSVGGNVWKEIGSNLQISVFFLFMTRKLQISIDVSDESCTVL